MHEIVKEYYGRRLQHTGDLKTSACCDGSDIPAWLRPLLNRIHPDVLSRYYGCGLVCPPLLKGCRVLDLGCGSGRDVYVLSQLVGPDGEVVGVDMTEEQLAVAEQYRAFHQEAFGYDNVRFILGYIEKLDTLDLDPESFDVIVSNCVVNLVPDKDAVLRGVRHLLKDGGEFYFSDVYSDRRIGDDLRQDPVLYGECLGGALYWNDFLSMAQRQGFADPRLVTGRTLALTDDQVRERVGRIRFMSATYRLFKLEQLEAACEDYGQAVIYRGTVEEYPDCFVLDQHHIMETGKVFPVCGNTWLMLRETRFAEHFDFIGDFSRHYGLFAGCGGELPFDHALSREDERLENTTSGGCC